MYNMRWSGCCKTHASEGVARSAHPSSLGVWKIDIRPHNSSWTSQEPPKITYFRLQKPPRALQEPFKRLSAAIKQLISCDPNPFYIDAAI